MSEQRRQRGEGSVHLRSDGRWAATLDLGWRDGKRRRKTIYAATQREAIKKLNAAKKELATHGDLPTASLTVEAWLRKWLTDIAAEKVQDTTLPGYRSKMEHYVIPSIGRKRLDRLAPEDLRTLYRGMANRVDDKGQPDPLSPATIVQTHRILSRALKVAVREGKVTRNVATLIDAPSLTSTETEPLNATETAAVLAACAGDRLESRWLAALLLGLRQGEALGLGWEHVDLDAGTLRIERALARVTGKGLIFKKPKSAKSTRTIPLPDLVADSLARRKAAYEVEAAAPGYTPLGLVWGQLDGKPCDPKDDWEAWVALLDRAEVRRVRLHDARHSAATMLGLLGVPLPVMMAILGHSQVSVTMRYAHSDLQAAREAMSRLDSAHRALGPGMDG